MATSFLSLDKLEMINLHSGRGCRRSPPPWTGVWEGLELRSQYTAHHPEQAQGAAMVHCPPPGSAGPGTPAS